MYILQSYVVCSLLVSSLNYKTVNLEIYLVFLYNSLDIFEENEDHAFFPEFLH